MKENIRLFLSTKKDQKYSFYIILERPEKSMAITFKKKIEDSRVYQFIVFRSYHASFNI